MITVPMWLLWTLIGLHVLIMVLALLVAGIATFPYRPPGTEYKTPDRYLAAVFAKSVWFWTGRSVITVVLYEVGRRILDLLGWVR